MPGTASDNDFTFTYTPASQIRIRTTSNDLYAHKAHHNVERSYTVNGLNQYYQVGDYSVTHDDNGNLTSDGGVSFTYDTENRLTGASGAKTAQLIYDPLGRLFEVNNGSGGGVTRFLYDAWGIPNPDNIGRFQYTGQIWLSEIGMYHYKARTYSPWAGRFLQTDPIGYEDGMHLYRYVGNDPVGFVDPSGEQMESRSDQKRVIYVYPRKTHAHVLKNHSPASRGSTGRTHYNRAPSYSAARALAGRTIQNAVENNNTSEGTGGSTVYTAQETGFFSSLGTEGEDSNAVVTRPLTEITDPNMLQSVAEALAEPEMVATIAAAEEAFGGDEPIEVQVIVTQYPVDEKD